MKQASIILTSAVAALLLAGSVSANGSYGGRPAHPDPANPRSQSIFIYQLHPSEQKKDAMTVTNATDQPVELELFAVDGTTTNDGAFTCKQNAEPKAGAGAWVQLSRQQVSLPARESANIDFTVQVPVHADVGEHSACLAVQEKKPAQDDNASGGAVRITTRQAVRMAITVPGEMHRNVDIEQFAVEQKNGLQQYTVEMKNKGNVSADVDVALRVDDMFGREWYRNGGQYPVVREQTLSQQFRHNQRPFWGGWYTARLSIAYDKRPGVFGTADAAQLVRKEAASVTVFFWPTLPAWAIIIGVPLLLVGLIIWRFRRRQRRQVVLRR